jgi:hypothetical protein
MSETRFSANMIHGRLLRLTVLTAAVLSLMALMSPPALADRDYSCSQRGNISGDSDIKCFFDNGRRYVTFDTKISGLLTADEAEIIFYLLNENVVRGRQLTAVSEDLARQGLGPQSARDNATDRRTSNPLAAMPPTTRQVGRR